MISCINFKKRLNDFLYDSVSEDLKKSMEEHIQNCESCAVLYNEELQIKNVFKDVVNIRNTRFNSSRDEIIKNIDKNRYNKSFSNKLFYRIRRNMITYAASAVLFICITSGSIYFYNFYTNNSNKPTVVNDDYNFIENITDNRTNKEVQKNEEKNFNSFIETELPLPKTSSNKDVQEILNKISLEPISSSPWKFGYTDKNKIIFYNNSALLAYSYNSGKPKYYSGIDLDKIDGGYIQGPIHTDFNFSPSGDYVVINNELNDSNLQNNKYNMYLYNFKKSEMSIISTENKFLINDTWSNNSNYYVFGDKNGERIFVYDVLSGTNITIPFNKGNIDSIFISDYGDIIIESSTNIEGQTTLEKYILKKDNSYEPEEYFVPGIIIGMRENRVLYYNQGTIYQLIEGKSNPIKKLGAGFNIQKLEKRYAAFTDGICTYIYDYNNSFYKYNNSYAQDFSVEYSSDLKKSLLLNNNNVKVYSSDELNNAIELGYFDNFSSSYAWFDNNNLIRISQKSGSDKLGNFIIYKTNIISKPEKAGVKSKISSQTKEQYAPGILINSPNISSFEKANFILVNYFNNLKSENSTDALKIKDYKIKIIKVEEQDVNNIHISVECSILPNGNYPSTSSKSSDIDKLYNDKYYSISVFSEDNTYYIDNISTF